MRILTSYKLFIFGKGNTILLFTGTFLFSTLAAQQNILIPIETSQHALVIQMDKDNHPGIIYFGKKLSAGNDYGTIPRQYKQEEDNAGIYNSAYTPSGSWNLMEPAIRITHADGNTSLDLQYVNHHTAKQDDNVSITTILLKDPVYAVEVTLYYKVYAKENVIEQWSVITNKEKKPITLNKYASANLYFMADDYYLTHYHGTWAREMKPEETQLTAGIKVLKVGHQGRSFSTTHVHAFI
jgi:alpha-galactosidase